MPDSVVFDKVLSWKEDTNAIIKKAHTRLYCLIKLRSFDISSQILRMCFISAICGVLTCGCVCWGGNVSKQDRDRLDKIIKAASIVGKRQDRFDTYYQGRLTNKLTDILHDDTCPLKADFDNRIIERSGQFRVPTARMTRHAGSFMPSAVSVFIQKIGRTGKEKINK